VANNEAQPQPAKNDLPAVSDLVIADMRERDAIGTRLQPHNGRDVLKDAYQQALDLAAYLRQAIFERDGEEAIPEPEMSPDEPGFSIDGGITWKPLGQDVRIFYDYARESPLPVHGAG